MHQVNLNDYVKFKLTEKGNDLLENYRKELSELVNNEVNRESLVGIDENGNEYMQFWDFMKIFGNHLHNGQKAITEGNNVFFESYDKFIFG